MPFFSDQMGRSVELKQSPERIISLVPSQTELLFDLGLEKEVIGITKFCVHPGHWFHSKTRIGGTKDIRMDIIHQLHPDLIIANKEENNKKQIDELSKHYRVWISDIKTLNDALQMIESIGEITGKSNNARTLINQIKEEFAILPQPQTTNYKLQIENYLQTAYFIWRNPYMTAGGDCFINDMMKYCGFKNIFDDLTRYPEITIEQLQNANCQLLLLSSEPYPFKEHHAEELRTQLKSTKIILVDGEMFSWYGSRLAKAPAYFTRLLQQIQ